MLLLPSFLPSLLIIHLEFQPTPPFHPHFHSTCLKQYDPLPTNRLQPPIGGILRLLSGMRCVQLYFNGLVHAHLS